MKRWKTKHHASKCDVFVRRGWVILDEICDNLVINKKIMSKNLEENEKIER